jgi:hypothetical protein
MSDEVVDLTMNGEEGQGMDESTKNGKDVVSNSKADQESRLDIKTQQKTQNQCNITTNNNLDESLEKVEKRKQELRQKMAKLRKLDSVLPQLCRKYRCGFVYTEGLLSVPSQTEQEMDETRFFRSQTGYMGIHRRMFKKLDDEWEPDSDNPYDDSPSVDEDRVEVAAKRMALKIWVKRNMSNFEGKIKEFIFPPSLVAKARRYQKRLLVQEKKKKKALLGGICIYSDSKENAMRINVHQKQGDVSGKGNVSEIESGCTLVI